MSRRACLLLGLALLAVAAWARPAPVARSATPLAALGSSMGGARVLVEDVLFLRAEALRKGGRIEDAAALYEAVLEIDPMNEPALVFLVNTYVDELLPLGLDADERFTWWRKARGLLEEGLRRAPRSAVLEARLAFLYLDALRGQPDLVPYVEAREGDLRRAALRHLAVAAAEAEVLPRLGRTHLSHAAMLVQDVAVDALEAGDVATVAEALRIGDALLATRGPILAAMSLDTPGGPGLRALLEAALAAIRAVRDARPDPAARPAAVEAIAAYRALLPASPLPGTLGEILRRPP